MTTPIVAVVTFDHFSPFHCAVPCLIFGDILPGQPLFELKICCGDGNHHSHSAQGFTIQAPHGLEVLAEAEIIVIPFWHDPAAQPPAALLDALIAARARGARLVGLCLGTYVLAYAGLLNGRKASTHWEYEQDFCRRFPCVQLDTNALYVDDDGLVTSAGTAAGLDCCLYLVRQYHGSAIANKVARRLVIPPHREGGQVYRTAGARLHSRCQDEPVARSPACPSGRTPHPGFSGGPHPDEPPHLYPPFSSGYRPLGG